MNVAKVILAAAGRTAAMLAAGVIVGCATAPAPGPGTKAAALPAGIAQYQGQYPRIDDPLMRAAFIRDTMVSEYYYPRGTADYDQKQGQIVLNQETAGYLYSRYTPLTLHYVPGSRPVLERIVRRILTPGMTERQRVMAIVNYCHHGFVKDYPAPIPDNTVFLNATEEEILKLGGGECEDRARVIDCLCQVAGIPARFISTSCHFRPEEGYAMHGGHAQVEIYCEGGWAFFDSTVMDFYCVKQDGKLASLWDLRRHPELVEHQPAWVYKDCGANREKFIWYREEYLTTRETDTITNYDVWDFARYDWNWVPVVADPANAAHVQEMQWSHALARKLIVEAGVPPDKIK